MHRRRDFIKKLGLGTAGILTLSSFDLSKILLENDVFRVTILHTNDMHSHIDPFPNDHKRYAGLGGMAKRAALIKKMRDVNPHTLLVDCDDIFQGTPYFNFYGGELEFKLMSEMGYDCATMGNHDFDNGLEGFNNMLPHASFPFVTSNYDFTDTILKDKTHDYKIFHRGPIKIGVFGIGIKLEGLVNKTSYGNTQHLGEIETANKMAKELKDLGCDLVICLSHIGFQYDYVKLSDQDLAKGTENIDLILGGHTHTFLDQPVILANKNNESVIVNQAGWAGIILGKIDFLFDKNSKKKIIEESSTWLNKNYATKII
ncbi:MAG: metallophosphatase [Flavobacteriales bacterium]|nr:metallophosphatase [Flavobacteriales bacterium]